MESRPDVVDLAMALARESGLGQESVYAWLIELGRARNESPCSIPLCAAPGIVFVDGPRLTDYIQTCPDHRPLQWTVMDPKEDGPENYQGGNKA